MSRDFLPVTRKEMEERGISRPDFVYICGDAYVDHPSFGMAIITRLLEHYGYSVGIIPQPDWKDPRSISVFGEPRLAFLVSAGNMDSMVNHYTVSKKHRKEDAYSPGGKMGLRPDRALIAGIGNPPWLHLCGNCNTIHSMVETVTAEGTRAGMAAVLNLQRTENAEETADK